VRYKANDIFQWFFEIQAERGADKLTNRLDSDEDLKQIVYDLMYDVTRLRRTGPRSSQGDRGRTGAEAVDPGPRAGAAGQGRVQDARARRDGRGG